MITEAEWQSIHTAIKRSHKAPPIKHSTVAKRDKLQRKVWLHDYGDDPVPMASYEYEIKFHDAKTGTVQTALLRPKVPDVGDTVLVNEPMGSRGIARITGVVPKKKKTHKDFIFAAVSGGSPGLPTGAMIWWIGPLTGTGVQQPTPGYLYCNGAAISRSVYAALFAIVGTAYGTGDGSTTFNLPDYRDGKIPVPQGTGFAHAATGGAASTTLTTPNLPSHSHGFSAVSPYMLDANITDDWFFTNAGPGNGLKRTSVPTTGTTGSGTSFTNMPPYITTGGILVKY